MNKNTKKFVNTLAMKRDANQSKYYARPIPYERPVNVYQRIKHAHPMMTDVLITRLASSFKDSLSYQYHYQRKLNQFYPVFQHLKANKFTNYYLSLPQTILTQGYIQEKNIQTDPIKLYQYNEELNANIEMPSDIVSKLNNSIDASYLLKHTYYQPDVYRSFVGHIQQQIATETTNRFSLDKTIKVHFKNHQPIYKLIQEIKDTVQNNLKITASNQVSRIKDYYDLPYNFPKDRYIQTMKQKQLEKQTRKIYVTDEYSKEYYEKYKLRPNVVLPELPEYEKYTPIDKQLYEKYDKTLYTQILNQVERIATASAYGIYSPEVMKTIENAKLLLNQFTNTKCYYDGDEDYDEDYDDYYETYEYFSEQMGEFVDKIFIANRIPTRYLEPYRYSKETVILEKIPYIKPEQTIYFKRISSIYHPLAGLAYQYIKNPTKIEKIKIKDDVDAFRQRNYIDPTNDHKNSLEDIHLQLNNHIKKTSIALLETSDSYFELNNGTIIKDYNDIYLKYND